MKVQMTERGIIAVLALISCTTLIMCGKDTIVGFSMLAVVAGYYGLEVFPIPQIRRRKGGRDG